MFNTQMLCHLCDLVDLGVDEALDRIQSTGASGVTLIVTSGPLETLRCHGQVEPRILRSRGGFFFRPADEHYEETRTRPIVSSWLKGRDPLPSVVETCRRRSLHVRLRISAFELGRIAQRHPEAAGKTAFADTAPNTLCPANSEVRALLRSTIADVSRFNPDAVEITDLRYHSGALTAGGLDIGFDPGRCFLSVLGLCFSESSLQHAHEHGVDGAATRRWAQIKLNEVLTTGQPCEDDLDTLLDEAEIARDYIDCQTAAVESAIAAALDHPQQPVLLVMPGDRSGKIYPRSAGAAAGVILQTDESGDGESTAALADTGSLVTADQQPEVELDAAALATQNPQALVSALQSLADHHVPGVTLASFGFIPEAGLDAVRQAIRFATRSAP